MARMNWAMTCGRRFRTAWRVTKTVDAVYRYEVKALEPRLELKAEAVQAILDEVSASDPRAKNVSAPQLIDRHYLDEMDKSGFYESLWGKVKDKG